MDSLDIAVLRCLMVGFGKFPARSELRESYSVTAKKFSVSEATLRSRVRRLVGSGFLRSWGVFLNPNVLGHRVAVVRLDVLPPSAKEDAIRKFKLIEGVWRINNHYGNSVSLVTYYSDIKSLRQKVELMTRIANSEHVSSVQVRFPRCSYAFKRNDLAIIKSVQESPWRRYDAIAQRTHLSSKTVRRRLNGMIQDKVLFLTADLDVSKSKGSLIAILLVLYDGEEAAKLAEQSILALVSEKMFSAVLGNPEFSIFSLILDHIAQEKNILSDVNKFEGVKYAYLDMVEESIALFQAFRDQVDTLAMALEKQEMSTATS